MQIRDLGRDAIVSAGALSASGQLSETPLRSLHDVVAISHQDAARDLPADFEATVTYFRSYEKTLFVQDGEDAMYVGATTTLPLAPGDRISIRGTHETPVAPRRRAGAHRRGRVRRGRLARARPGRCRGNRRTHRTL